MIEVTSLCRIAVLSVVLAVPAFAAIAAEPAPAATSAAAPIPANIAQLESLFRHLDKVDAGRIDEFQASPSAFLVKYGPALSWSFTLSNRQVGLLAAGSTLATDLKRVMLGNNSNWIPGAVAVSAGCRPNYVNGAYSAAHSGVDGDIIPSDPVALMIWGWSDPNGRVDKDMVKRVLRLIRDRAGSAGVGETELKETLDELLNYILK
ncbi:hypothetical protein [Nevskia ramosa]|uniref:hypothetical protein n=1 Tax=Nevskia ramosa TaxID=64002 RepID=UPI003D12358F